MDKKKKIKLISIFIYIVLAAIIIWITYLFIINYFAKKELERSISEWQDAGKTVLTEEEESAQQEDSAGAETSEIGSDENPAGGDESADKEESGAIYSAPDFFPLKIIIPKVELELITNEGADPDTLKKGPGHIEGTSFPGEGGRCVISGHRTIYGAPFNRIDELEDGDIIYLELVSGELFAYIVTEEVVVAPTDVYIIEGTDKKELLLTTCEPKYSAVRRLIIIAEQINIFEFGLD